MAIVNGYLTLAELKGVLGDTGATHDGDYERAIEAASRQIDEWCRRQFWQSTPASPRVFDARTPYLLYTDDVATTAGLVIEVYGSSQAWSALTSTQFLASPAVGFNGRPINRFVSADGLFPVATNRAYVRVTAVWGWPTVPAHVRQACQILAVDHFKSKDLTGGIAGFGELGPVRIAAFSPQARALLEFVRLPGMP